jgi:FkbM family methyltransferase
MAKEIDFDWISHRAQDYPTKHWLKQIEKWRRFTLENNKFLESDEPFMLHLGNQVLSFRKSSAFSSIEIYQEIFKENSHFIAPGFSGNDACVVFDIGANEGFYSLKLAEHNSNVKLYCIEPNPYVFEILKENMNNNNINNTVLINKAASSSIGKIDLEIIKEIACIGGRNLRIVDRPWLKDEFITHITVDSTTLDELIDKHKVLQIDILKIDAEGMEMDILHGCQNNLHRVKRIVVERHSKELRDKVVSFLRSRKFKVVFEEDPTFNQHYGDIYFINQNIE